MIPTVMNAVNHTEGVVNLQKSYPLYIHQRLLPLLPKPFQAVKNECNPEDPNQILGYLALLSE